MCSNLNVICEELMMNLELSLMKVGFCLHFVSQCYHYCHRGLKQVDLDEFLGALFALFHAKHFFDDATGLLLMSPTQNFGLWG